MNRRDAIKAGMTAAERTRIQHRADYLSGLYAEAGAFAVTAMDEARAALDAGDLVRVSWAADVAHRALGRVAGWASHYAQDLATLAGSGSLSACPDDAKRQRRRSPRRSGGEA